MGRPWGELIVQKSKVNILLSQGQMSGIPRFFHVLSFSEGISRSPSTIRNHEVEEVIDKTPDLDVSEEVKAIDGG